MFNIFWLLYNFLFHYQTHFHHSMFSISFRLTLVIAVVITNWQTSELVDCIGFFIADRIIVLMLLLGGLLDSLLYTRVDFWLDECLILWALSSYFPVFCLFFKCHCKVVHFCYELVMPRHRKKFSSHLIGKKYFLMCKVPTISSYM